MRVLVIDTCGHAGSIALAEIGPTDNVATATIPGRSASERLLPALRELCAVNQVSLRSLDAIAVVNGPGSFTGVRVGLSAAKGLCEALDLPIIAISRLAIMADLAGVVGSRICALLDAGRAEFYSGIYVEGNCVREALLTRGELFGQHETEAAKQPIEIVVCEPAVANSIAELHPHHIPEPTAQDAVRLAVARLRENRFDDLLTLDANYLRRTDAQIFAKKVPQRDAGSGVKS